MSRPTVTASNWRLFWGSSPRTSCPERRSSDFLHELAAMRRARVLLWPAGIGVGLIAEWMFFDFRDAEKWVPDLVAGWSLIAAGLVAWRGRWESGVGLLLVGSGFTWFVGNFSGVDTEWVAWIAAHGVYVHRGPLLHSVVTFPTGRAVMRWERAA